MGGENMIYDYSSLLGRITEKCKTQAIFAKKMGLSEHSISRKLNNIVPFKQYEITKASVILEIPQNELAHYFFKIVVQ